MISLRRISDEEVIEAEQLGVEDSADESAHSSNEDRFAMLLNIIFTSCANAAAFQQRDILGKNDSYCERADTTLIPFKIGSNLGTNRFAEY